MVSRHPRQHDRAHYSEVQRTGNIEQVHKVLQHEQQRRADENANYGTFTTSQAATAQHRRRDAVKLVEISVVRGRNGICVEREQDARNTREQSGQDISAGYDPARVDAGETRGLFVAADREKITSID